MFMVGVAGRVGVLWGVGVRRRSRFVGVGVKELWSDEGGIVQGLLGLRGGARIFCLGGPNFVTNISVSSQDKSSHSGINAHTQI